MDLNISLITNICSECHKILQISAEFKERIIKIQDRLLSNSEEHPGEIPFSENFKQEVCSEESSEGIPEIDHIGSLKIELLNPEFESEEYLLSDNEEEIYSNTNAPETTQTSKRKDQVLCSECGGIFRKESLKVHRERVHLKIKRFFCDLCKYESYQKAHIRSHMAVHTKQRNFQCHICDLRLQFQSQSALKSHIFFKHSIERPFICDYENCTKSFKRKRLLTDHIRAIHMKERNFVCNFPGCQQSFSKPTLLKNHRIKHFEEPKISCEFCGKLYFTIHNLQKHLITHGEPMFACEFCNKKFYKKYNWEIHSKTHFGIRDFSCEYCECKYYKKDHLNR